MPALHILALFCCLALISGVARAQQPNVIIVMADDQGYGELSVHGNPVVTTPNLDALHGESVRFTDFHVAPMCTPTRGQLMTGLDAFRNGAMNVSSGRTLLRRGLPTMADYFKGSGYATGIFGKWHLGDNYPYRPQDRGFDESLWFPSSHISSTPDFWENDYFDDTYYHNGDREAYEGYCTDIFFSQAIRWMKSQADADQPFFAYIPLNSPHGPLFVPDEYRGPVAERLEAASDMLPELEPGQRRGLISYLAMIENIDENIGRLDAFLADEDLRQNTIVIFLTDNGSTFGPRYYNAGMQGGKVTLWEGGHRVPLFIRWPNGEFGEARDESELTQVQDLLPTLIELCDLQTIEDAPAFDGLSLAGLLRGTIIALPDRMLIVNYSRMPFDTTRPSTDHDGIPRREGAAVLWNRWRLLEDRMLFNLDTDPLQENNVIEQHPEVVAAMRQQLDAWWDGVKETVNEPSRVVIGNDIENPLMLTACEWFDVFIDQQRQVRVAEEKVGVWHLSVDQPGEYTIELRRYPRESGLAINEGVPPTPVTDGQYVAGRELNIASARLQIGDFNETVPIESGTESVTFEVSLDAGPIEMLTVFLDAEGNEVCGAYYAYVERQ